MNANEYHTAASTVDDTHHVQSPALVSIIMPTYNRAHLILETIRSVQSQTYSSWELIIVDDGSDDDTETIIASIGDERISFHKAGRIDRNGMIKNIGLQKAQGALIAFIDSDDLWHERKLEKQAAALQANPNAGFSLVGGYNFEESNPLREYFYSQREGKMMGSIFLSLFRSEIAVFVQALLLRRECLAVTGGFPEETNFSDSDFIIRLSRHFECVLLYEPMLYRRIHTGNHSQSTWATGHEKGISLLQSYRGDPLVPRDLLRTAVFKSYIRFGEKNLRYNERIKALHKFFKAWLVRPWSIVPWKKTGKVFFSWLSFLNHGDTKAQWNIFNHKEHKGKHARNTKSF
jgi:glycosyltransferase involved in cell wall biosynthesis